MMRRFLWIDFFRSRDKQGLEFCTVKAEVVDMRTDLKRQCQELPMLLAVSTSHSSSKQLT